MRGACAAALKGVSGEHCNPCRASRCFSRHGGHIRRQSAANVARRLKTAVKRANGRLAPLGIEPISERAHTRCGAPSQVCGLRLGDDPVYIAEQLGHTDPRFTLTVYTKAVKRRAKLHGAYLAEYERALAWGALPGTERGTRHPFPGGATHAGTLGIGLSKRNSAPWRSGYAAACKAVYAGSIPAGASGSIKRFAA